MYDIGFSTLYDERPSATVKQAQGAFRTARVFMSRSQPAIALLPSDLKHSAGQDPIASLETYVLIA